MYRLAPRRHYFLDLFLNFHKRLNLPVCVWKSWSYSAVSQYTRSGFRHRIIEFTFFWNVTNLIYDGIIMMARSFLYFISFESLIKMVVANISRYVQISKKVNYGSFHNFQEHVNSKKSIFENIGGYRNDRNFANWKWWEFWKWSNFSK